MSTYFSFPVLMTGRIDSGVRLRPNSLADLLHRPHHEAGVRLVAAVDPDDVVVQEHPSPTNESGSSRGPVGSLTRSCTRRSYRLGTVLKRITEAGVRGLRDNQAEGGRSPR